MVWGQFEDNNVVHHARPVLHHLVEIGGKVVRTPEDRVESGGEKPPFQVIDFLKKNLRLEIGGEDADETFLLQSQIPCGHIGLVVVLPGKFEDEFPFFRDHICLILEDSAHGADGESGKLRQFFECNLRHIPVSSESVI